MPETFFKNRAKTSPELIADLAACLEPDRVSVRGGDLDQHAQDQSSHAGARPDVVVWPRDAEEVRAVLRLANQRAIPVTPWGAGTSLEGNPIPVQGGIVMDFQHMNRILEIHESDFQVTVEPGVLYKDMNEILGKQGLFFAPDPGANASVGGMLANNAAGVRTVKYGATRDNVLALEVVLADGTLIQTGSRSTKQSSGYDLTHFFVGSEGTLGVITKATLQLAPIPEHFSAAIAAFPEVENAAEAVFRIVAHGLEPAALEILDTHCVRLLNREEQMGLPEMPTLLMEFTGATQTELHEKLKLVDEIAADCECESFNSGVGRSERERIWEVRHRLFEILVRSHPGKTWLLSDISVPVSAFPALVHKAREAYAARGLDAIINGHAGDGNIHTTYFFDRDDDATREHVHGANTELQEFALTLDGTSTGEHGIGLGKKKCLLPEHGPETVEVMRRLKRTLDPKGILNPGKIFDD